MMEFAAHAEANVPPCEPCAPEPRRGGYMSLAEQAVSLARKSRGAVPPGSRRLLRRFRDNARRLEEDCDNLGRLSRDERLLPSATEWLLDNRYILEEVLRGVHVDLPAGFYRELPADDDGIPRVYALAAALVARSDSAVHEPELREAVEAYQTVAPLTIGEIWAFPTMLRLALVENLRRLADGITHHVRDHEAASIVLASLVARRDARLPATPSDAFAIALWEGLRDLELPESPALEAARVWGTEPFAAIADLQHREFCRQAADQVSIGNAITSLRLLGIVDWLKFFESVSLVEKTLRADPIHSRQDQRTRDACRRAVERLSRATAAPEREVASRAVELGAVHADRPASWFLLGGGRPVLERALGSRPSWSSFQKEWIVRRPNLVYFGLFLLFLVPLVALPITLIPISAGWKAAAAALLFLPASEVALAFVNFAAGRLVAPRLCARLDVHDGIPDGCETFIAIPTMIARPEQAAALVEKLEQHYLANPDPRLFFALLTDYPDADEPHRTSDLPCVTTLFAEVESLNHRHGFDARPRFFVLQRKRRLNPSEGKWMGWERKRGKLEEFNRLLRGAKNTSFEYLSHTLEGLPQFRFVLTLDTDTVLPRDAAKQMVAVLAHPLNRARLSPDGRTVESGYGLLQPRVSFLYRTSFRSRFTRIFAGSAGIDPYSAAVSDTYMDLFGRGTFTGKGLYDIDAFQATAGRAFPDNAILSHDLVESNFARCALATDVEVFDEFPARYHAYAKRDHRWIRGDWQLLPWLGRNVPTPDGPRGNPLGFLERWKIVDNLRRSLLPIGTVLLMLAGWTILPVSPLLWTGLALLPLATPTLLYLFESLRSVLAGKPVRSLYARAKTDLAATVGQGLLQVAFLLNQAVNACDAIARTLYRLFVSRRHMLEWESAAAADSRLKDSLGAFVRFIGPSVLICVGIAALVASARPSALPAAGPILFLWLTAPLTAWFVSRSRERRTEELTEVQRSEMLRVARKTWDFFERFVGPEDNWLPPDNFQEQPLGVVAHRTSPTNIGLYLLTVAAARSLGLIGPDVVIHRIANAFATLDKLPRHRGHFLNWYETDTLRVLPPAYVSTVDSGNLRACLLALRHALLEAAVEQPDRAGELRSLSERAARFAGEMDFRFLYNPERDLFTIGFNADAGKADANHYDLLASEACIASFLAVAYGEAPRKHWFMLGRLMTTAAGEPGLVSWGGTMFEYLMPRILLPAPAGVLLDQAQRAAVARQIEYGAETGTPWGVSESGYYAVDAAQVYQYLSFGVPGLGLKRGLDKDRVVAPYATLMAVDVRPAEALRNLTRITAEGGEGPYGFYEAIDYTAAHVPAGSKCMVVRSYMAHHQGMGFLALANRLKDGLARNWLRREPAVRATELLLEERVPFDAPLMETTAPEVDADRMVEPDFPSRRRITTADTPTPRVQLLSNGRFTTMVTNAGGGFTRFRELDVARWRADATCDAAGSYLYIRDRRSREVWSAAHHPVRKQAEEYEVFFSLDKVDYRRLDAGIDTLLEVTVAPDRDVELRRVTLTNLGKTTRELDVTSYLEVVLLSAAADTAHPAFGKLFLETEWLEGRNALLCKRRTRSPEEKPVWAFHGLACENANGVSYETDREAFIGRRRSPSAPAALDAACRNLGGNVGPVLDPVFALRLPVRLKAGEKVTFAFATGAADTREEALAMAEYYRDLPAVHRGFDLAWAHAMIETKHARLRPDDVHLFQRLAGFLLYPLAALRAPAEVLAANTRGQSGLWAFGISGDLPICLLRLHGPAGVGHLRQLLQAHAFWRSKAFKADLVILCENAGGYYDVAFDDALAAVRSAGMAEFLDKPGGVFVRKRMQMDDAERILLLSAATLVLDDQSGPLAAQANNVPGQRRETAEGSFRPAPRPRFQDLPPLGGLLAPNRFGGFAEGGSEYAIEPNRGERVPPAPWSNVIANPAGGFLVTDSGGGFAWAGNSQRNRITPWSNDPVRDPVGEAIYISDEKRRLAWCPTPLPIRDDGPARVRHGRGFSVFERIVEEVHHELTVGMAEAEPVKISLLKVRNDGKTAIDLAVAYYVEWTLGTHRAATAAHVVTSFNEAAGCLLARNAFNPEASGAVAFASASFDRMEHTGDRQEFIGRNGTLDSPAGLRPGAWSGRTGAGLDPCAAIRGWIALKPGEERSIVFLLGQGTDEADALRMREAFREPAAARAELDRAVARWKETTAAVRVTTPDPAFDALMNHWLVYQVLSCRYWGRSAFSQSGGAYGFRDQLQDVLALLHTVPALAREHILRAAARQFPEGDVQHWWHPRAGDGVRTRFSDDFLWLPYALHCYIEATGDAAVLDARVPFIEGNPLPADKQEMYETPRVSEQTAPLYEHCLRALDHGWKLGTHGLPLMGCGDWNDGMNHVGAEGRGESVWVAWFQILVRERFAEMADRRGDSAVAVDCREKAAKLREAVERHGHEGAWYLRAFCDDGSRLGAAGSRECALDSLTQSWAAIAGGADKERVRVALDAVVERLVKPNERLVLLFDPPFDDGPAQPGYIKGYVPGTRENGGQYTHAACWVAQALAMEGRGDEAYAVFDLLNPAKTDPARYRGEPYVIAADVYSNPNYPGRAGWTWYTGSASWMYRVGLESILGLKRTGDTLTVSPAWPAEWDEFKIEYRVGEATWYAIHVLRTTKDWGVVVDGKPLPGSAIPLQEDRLRHEVTVRA